MSIKVKIKRFDKSLPLPAYKTEGAACTDVYAREEVIIEPNSIGYIPLNIALEIPKGYWVLLAARGSTHKLGLIPANGIGIGDWDFKGDNDEYKLVVYNFSKSQVKIEKGIRVAQFTLIKNERIDFEEVDRLDNPDRTGFGSTGVFN